jgi:hypothetical protein
LFGAEIARHAVATNNFTGEPRSRENYSQAGEEGKKAQERQEAGADVAVENGELKRIV